MSKLSNSQFIKCCFCDQKMFDILLCMRTRGSEHRCQSVTCSDCRLCGNCTEDLHFKLKDVKRWKHQADEQERRMDLIQTLKEEFDIDIE